MATKLKEKQRTFKNRARRNLKTKNTILIGLEGEKNNKTESLYFQNFQGREKPYNIITCKGNFTDPINMLDSMEREMKKRELDINSGDKAYCIFDADCDVSKDKQIKEAEKLAKQKGVDLIISVPCFENWLLCHFRYSTKILTNAKAREELLKYIPNYQKNIDIYPQICHLTKEAIKNAKKQNHYHEMQNKNLSSVESNPSTQVYRIIEELLKQEKLTNSLT